MKHISDEIKKLEAEHVNKVYSEEDLEKRNELDKQLEQIQYLYNVCRIDCELRNRHRISGEEPPPIDEKLREELEELESDDDVDNSFRGGNKRQSRRLHRRRRRSIRNKTKQKHSRRRHTRNARRRGRGQRTRRDKK